MVEWAVQLDHAKVGHLASLRLRDGVRVCEDNSQLWLRGVYEESPDPAIRSLPGPHFTIVDRDQLVPAGKRVPHGYLPATDWLPLREWLQVSVPVARWAKVTPPEIVLRLEPAAITATSRDARLPNAPHETAPTAILVSAEGWKAYADSAPQVRLEQLRFAASSDGQILVIGTPLPSLPGTQFVIDQGIAIPAGMRWCPTVDATAVRKVIGAVDVLVLWEATDSWELIPDDAFVAATRVAIRSTFSALKEGDR